ncbi:AMP-binding protein [Psychrobacillus sp. PGGUH221]|uniref:AMP-binding protein n=1 Tax=Psychrobacillus sp. PGGUH221 TaxID=3020058 RepID=UPI0035C6C083
MRFWELEETNAVAISTVDGIYTYQQLYQKVNHICLHSTKKELVLLLCENTIEIIAAYLAALQSNHAVMLVSADANKELLENIVKQYQPKWIIGNISFEGYRKSELFAMRESDIEISIHPDLAVLLSTSGTTGSQKFVRLSYENIQSNAESISEYLKLDADERAVMNLPLSYSYGLSIVNSHLQVGATVLLTDESIMAKSFWDFVKKHQATSIAGVPFTYQMLQRIGFMKMDLPYLKTMTQAGGRLSEKLVRTFGEYAHANDKRFYVMYGQTEASPRMSYIPPENILEKAGSIGITIPGGELSIADETGELIYKGANVMMGYAECMEDLAKGDECGNVLYTGDTAEVDGDGYFTITGRMKRFIKLFGLRINLDDVEKKLEAHFQVALACTGNDDKLIVAVESYEHVESIKTSIEELYKLHKSAFKIVVIEAIPRFTNGKTDYRSLKEAVL